MLENWNDLLLFGLFFLSIYATYVSIYLWLTHSADPVVLFQRVFLKIKSIMRSYFSHALFCCLLCTHFIPSLIIHYFSLLCFSLLISCLLFCLVGLGVPSISLPKVHIMWENISIKMASNKKNRIELNQTISTILKIFGKFDFKY